MNNALMTLAFVGPIAVFIYLASLRKSLKREKKKNEELRKEVTITQRDSASHQRELIDLRKRTVEDSLSEDEKITNSRVYRDLVDRLETIKKDKNETIESLKNSLLQSQSEYRHLSNKYSQSNIESASANVAIQMSGEIFDRLSKKFTEHVSSFRDELTNRSFQDLAAEQEKIIPEIISSFQQCKSKYEDKPILFPNNSRLLYSIGKRTLMVVEQEPMVRSLFFSARLRDTENGGTIIKDPSTGNSYLSYNLALPFFYFFLIFDKDQEGVDRLRGVKLAFAKRRIENKDSILYTVPLPNTEIDGHDITDMCMGNGFYYGDRDEDGFIRDDTALKNEHSINEQAKIAVDHYWTRVFNTDRGNGNYNYVDQRMCTLEQWEKSSQEDPFFPLTVEWKFGRTLEHYISHILNDRDRSVDRFPEDEVEYFVRDRLKKIIFDSSERLEKDYRKFIDSFRNDEESISCKVDLEKELFNGFTKINGRLRRR